MALEELHDIAPILKEVKFPTLRLLARVDSTATMVIF